MSPFGFDDKPADQAAHAYRVVTVDTAGPASRNGGIQKRVTEVRRSDARTSVWEYVRKSVDTARGRPISPVQAGILVFCLCLLGVLVGLSWIRETTARVRADRPAVQEHGSSGNGPELP